MKNSLGKMFPIFVEYKRMFRRSKEVAVVIETKYFGGFASLVFLDGAALAWVDTDTIKIIPRPRGWKKILTKLQCEF